MKHLPNFILMNALWLGAVLGAANGLMWPAYLIFAALLADAWVSPEPSDWPMALISLGFGLSVDVLIGTLGWMNYAHVGHAMGLLSPFWIMMLWVGFGLSLNRSMSWVFVHPHWGLLFILIGAPLSYYSAEKLGGVQISQIQWMLPLLALVWLVYWGLLKAVKQPIQEVVDVES